MIEEPSTLKLIACVGTSVIFLAHFLRGLWYWVKKEDYQKATTHFSLAILFMLLTEFNVNSL